MQKIAWIVGVGPGLGSALAEQFAEAGYALVLSARTEGTIRSLAERLGREGRTTDWLAYDASDSSAVDAAVADVLSQHGRVDVLVYNVGNMVRGGVEGLSPETFLGAYLVGPYGAFLHLRRLLPRMAAEGGGTVLLTGATSSVRAPATAPAFAAAKFGLRGLALSLARAWSSHGIHVVHVLIDGVLRTPRAVSLLGPDERYLEPRDVAELYVQLTRQPPSAWSFEVDVRPRGDDVLEN